MRSSLRAVFVLFIASALVTACGAAGPRWQDILSVGMKFGQCINDTIVPEFDKFADAGSDAGRDAATDAE